MMTTRDKTTKTRNRTMTTSAMSRAMTKTRRITRCVLYYCARCLQVQIELTVTWLM